MSSSHAAAVHCDRKGRALELFLFSMFFMLPVIAYNATLILPTLSKLQVTSVPQVEAAFGFFALVGPEFYDREKFEESCGIGEIINLGVVHC